MNKELLKKPLEMRLAVLMCHYDNEDRPSLKDALRAELAATSAKPDSEEFDRALKKHETNYCMFERGVQTFDDLLRSREIFIKSVQPATSAKPAPVKGEPNEATVMLNLADSIAASAHPEEGTRLEVAYAIARHLKLDWPSAVQSDHEIRHWAEEYECSMKCLDDAGVPKADSSEKVYSLWGRIKAYTTPQLATSAKPARKGDAKNAELSLQAAAQAVLDRWNSPKWEWSKQGLTADLMHNLKDAIASQKGGVA